MANIPSDGEEYSAGGHEGVESSLSSLELEQINDEPYDEEAEYQENLIKNFAHT
jgi:hypothetical protein